LRGKLYELSITGLGEKYHLCRATIVDVARIVFAVFVIAL